MSKTSVVINKVKILIYAEDVDSPGTYRAVQGQYNSDGNFVLLTTGAGSATVTDYAFQDGSSYTFQDGTNYTF